MELRSGDRQLRSKTKASNKDNSFTFKIEAPKPTRKTVAKVKSPKPKSPKKHVFINENTQFKSNSKASIQNKTQPQPLRQPQPQSQPQIQSQVKKPPANNEKPKPKRQKTPETINIDAFLPQPTLRSQDKANDFLAPSFQQPVESFIPPPSLNSISNPNEFFATPLQHPIDSFTPPPNLNSDGNPNQFYGVEFHNPINSFTPTPNINSNSNTNEFFATELQHPIDSFIPPPNLNSMGLPNEFFVTELQYPIEEQIIKDQEMSKIEPKKTIPKASTQKKRKVESKEPLPKPVENDKRLNNLRVVPLKPSTPDSTVGLGGSFSQFQVIPAKKPSSSSNGTPKKMLRYNRLSLPNTDPEVIPGRDVESEKVVRLAQAHPPLDLLNWDDQVDRVITIRANNNSGLTVFLLWLDGKCTAHRFEEVKEKSPQKLIRFIEKHLQFPPS